MFRKSDTRGVILNIFLKFLFSLGQMTNIFNFLKLSKKLKKIGKSSKFWLEIWNSKKIKFKKVKNIETIGKCLKNLGNSWRIFLKVLKFWATWKIFRKIWKIFGKIEKFRKWKILEKGDKFYKKLKKLNFLAKQKK